VWKRIIMRGYLAGDGDRIGQFKFGIAAAGHTNEGL
jgi:hypothetical protein